MLSDFSLQSLSPARVPKECTCIFLWPSVSRTRWRRWLSHGKYQRPAQTAAFSKTSLFLHFWISTLAKFFCFYKEILPLISSIPNLGIFIHKATLLYYRDCIFFFCSLEYLKIGKGVLRKIALYKDQEDVNSGRPGTSSALMNGGAPRKLPGGELKSDSSVQWCHHDRVWNRSGHDQFSLRQMLDFKANISQILKAFHWNVAEYWSLSPIFWLYVLHDVHQTCFTCFSYLLSFFFSFQVSSCVLSLD